ncbi:M15 family metallopeptidase [Agrococcus jejuensis]|uniref:D-alanyl-D-alanine carboxypeptidase n=1 Tax=Agrococcus jejuensis TaxID=399736 RepID=A0A1G8FE80_9MICO|nr:M15 family metallopeptidase [Agrococcus jejuensis]SDH80458.1 D-alanyl-D-alanine carboxypeptidase [Agrococcus jejuensis]
MTTAAAPPHRRRRALVAVGLVAAALATIAVPTALERALDALASGGSVVELSRVLPIGDAAEPGVDDGLLPDGPVSPYADVPAITGLAPDLLAALRAASDAAAADGVEVVVNSGWRSAALQQAMLDEAIVTYGSAEEAARWVSTPDESAHVTGDAVDVGGWDGADWMGRHGWAWGLCQTYANESWHFELRPEAVDGACPPMASDPTAAH